MTKVSVGPLEASLCVNCSKPAFHVMGLLDWFKSKV